MQHKATLSRSGSEKRGDDLAGHQSTTCWMVCRGEEGRLENIRRGTGSEFGIIPKLRSNDDGIGAKETRQTDD